MEKSSNMYFGNFLPSTWVYLHPPAPHSQGRRAGTPQLPPAPGASNARNHSHHQTLRLPKADLKPGGFKVLFFSPIPLA